MATLKSWVAHNTFAKCDRAETGRGFDLISVRYDAEFSALCKEMRLKLTKG
jgi:hypothetical protein